MLRIMKQVALPIVALTFLTSCSYNPFTSSNHTTGSPTSTLVGAAAGAGGVALLGGSKYGMLLGGIGGGMIGYYVSTLRFDSGGVIQSGGQVYKVGDFVGIDIPSDKLFEPNTADFLPQADAILDSAAVVLQRYPSNNIMVSGNTSGFGKRKWQQQLSERRAKAVAAYLWNAGINQFKDPGMGMRKLNYVGYGDFFPIASKRTNDDLRANSRIQITSYPSKADLGLDKRHMATNNVGSMDDDTSEAVANGGCEGTKEGCG